MKKKKLVFLVIVFLFLVPTVAFAAGATITAVLAPQIQIVSTGKNIDTSANPPIIYNERTYVPLRAVSEALGYEVKWDGANQRIDLIEPESNSGKISKKGIEVIEYIASPSVMVSIHDVVSASYSGEILYRITEELQNEMTATFQVLNKDNQVVGFETIIFREMKPGTYKHHFNVGYFRTKYDGKEGRSVDFEEKMLSDYSYRLILN